MRAKRIDANHAAIVAALRKIGAVVHSLASVGDGCPDLLVGYKGQTYLMEIKDGDKSKSSQALTKYQVNWHDSWCGGPLSIASSVQSALNVLGSNA